MIKVDPGAQRIDAFQECRNLLISKKAHADAIPGLEILANDVRCTHAAAIAQLDPDQLFYLRSRGLDEAHARNVLTYAFAAQAVGRIEPEALRGKVASAIRSLVPGGAALGEF
jgi:Fe-S cluster assembly protein SufD